MNRNRCPRCGKQALTLRTRLLGPMRCAHCDTRVRLCFAPTIGTAALVYVIALGLWSYQGITRFTLGALLAALLVLFIVALSVPLEIAADDDR